MSVVVFEVVTLGLEGVVVFVLDLPAAAGRFDHVDDIVGGGGMGGGPGVAVEPLGAGVGGGQFAPAGQEGIVAVAQGQMGQVTLGIGEAPFAIPTLADQSGTLMSRVEQHGQEIVSEQKCSVPSLAIRKLPPMDR